MADEERIREIERIIDEYHKSISFFRYYCHKRDQALWDVLAIYNKFALLETMGIVQTELWSQSAELFSFSQINDLMDSLNIAVQWIYEECDNEEGLAIEESLDEERNKMVIELLTKHADKYAVIVDGFINYSRKNYTGRVDNNKVVFDCNDFQYETFLADVGEESADEELMDFESISEKIKAVYSKLKGGGGITSEDNNGLLSISDDMHEMLLDIGEKHWQMTSSLPQEWEFDGFSLEEFKCCWKELYVLSYSSILGVLVGESKHKGMRVIGKMELKDYLVTTTGIASDRVNAIIALMTYDPSLKNTDIMYQPFIDLNNRVILTSTLIVTGRPERNLLAIIQKKRDSHYSKEVNGLEMIMGEELKTFLPKDVESRLSVKLGKDKPDIDLIAYDKENNYLLLVEMKWLIAADSAREVLERQKDVDHGCAQMESIMQEVMKNPTSTIEHFFDYKTFNYPDLFWCVVTKHNVRTTNKLVPVIKLATLEEMLQQLPYVSALHRLRNKEYSRMLPENVSRGHKPVSYAGYVVEVPALKCEPPEV